MPHSAPGINVEEDGVFVRRTQTVNAATGLTASASGDGVDLDAEAAGGSDIATSLDGTPLSAATTSLDATEGLFASAVADAVTYSVYGARSGTLAARPAAARSNKRGFYYATDTKTAYQSDGSTWTTLFVLGTMSSQDASAVAITGGTISGITDLAVADGGTGASTASDARTNLQLVPGTDVQSFDVELAAIAGLVSAANKLAYFTGSGTASLTDLTAFIRTLLDDADAATARTTLGAWAALSITAVKTTNYSAAANELVPVDTTSGNVTVTFPTAPADGSMLAVKQVIRGGTNTVGLTLGGSDKFNTSTGAASGTLTLSTQAVLCQYKASTAIWYVVADDLSLAQLDLRYQPLDAELTAMAGLVSAADKLPYFTGSGTAALTTLTTFIRTLLDDADAATARTTLGLDAPLTTRLHSLTAIGDSWIAGTTTADTGTFLMEREGTIAKLCGMLGVHEDNLTHLGMGASALTSPTGGLSLASSFAGWSAIAQFVLPNGSPLIADPTTPVNVNTQVSPQGAFLVSFINDPTRNIFSAATQGRTAFKHALRWAASRCRASTLYSSRRDTAGAIQWDASLSFGASWADAAGVTRNTGPASRQLTTLAGTAADAIVYTIPTEFKGGYVVPSFMGAANCLVFTNAVINDTSTGNKAAWASTAEFPQTGQFILHLQNEDILASVVNATTLNFITRGVNGTSNVVHNSSGLACTITAPQIVTFTTNATGADATAITGPGTLAIGAQGYAGMQVPICRRFNLSSAAAGKTITMTVTGRIANDQQVDQFDTVHVETATPGPFVVRNFPRFGFGGVYSSFVATDWNSDIATIQAEFDTLFQIADLDAIWAARSCTINTAGTGVSLNVTPLGSPTAFPAPGVTGWVLCCQGEDMLVTANVAGTGITQDLTLTRNYNGAGAATHINQTASDGSFTFSDRIHPNPLGHTHNAKAFFDAFNAAITLSTYQIAAQAGVWTQDNHVPVLGMQDLSFIAPQLFGPVAGIGTSLTLSIMRAFPIYVPQECIVVSASVRQGTTAGTTTSARIGIYDNDVTRQRPGALIAELGSVTTNSASSTRTVTCFKRLRPGWYWVAFVNQGTTASSFACIPANGIPTNINSLTDVNTATPQPVLGYVTGATVTGAMPATWPAYTETSGGAGAGASLPYITLGVRTKAY